MSPLLAAVVVVLIIVLIALVSPIAAVIALVAAGVGVVASRRRPLTLDERRDLVSNALERASGHRWELDCVEPDSSNSAICKFTSEIGGKKISMRAGGDGHPCLSDTSLYLPESELARAAPQPFGVKPVTDCPKSIWNYICSRLSDAGVLLPGTEFKYVPSIAGSF